MNRILSGFALLAIAVGIAWRQPHVLDGWSVLGWWAAIGLGIGGGVMIADELLEADDDEECEP